MEGVGKFLRLRIAHTSPTPNALNSLAAMSFALFSSPPSTAHLPPHSAAKLQSPIKPISLSFKPKRLALLGVFTCAAEDAAAGAVEAEKVGAELNAPEAVEKKEEEEPVGSNGSVKKTSTAAGGAPAPMESEVVFQDPKWVAGTWDLTQFQKDGKTNWDAVIDAEAKRRKWLELNPESSNNESPVVFDTSIIPWWAWVKRYHLPEAELLNGRAAMVGFFMAYFVDSLTGVGLVDQMGNFFCKTLLFVAVVGVLVIRKNEDIETVKKLLEESTFYDKQWQATWQDENKKDL